MNENTNGVEACVIGLGQMGGAMAATLHRAGVDVCGVDVEASARQRSEAAGVPVAAPDAMPRAPLYLLSLPTAAQVRAVIEDDPGLLGRVDANTVVVDTSTSEPAISRALAQRLEAVGAAWLDAPVSGGPRGAATGKLGMLIGGSAVTLERVRDRLDLLAATITHVGGPGAGHTVKLANNYLCATNLLAVAEAVALASAGGVDPDACLRGLNSGSGRSAVSEINFPEWIASGRFDSGFTAGLMRKDLRLARDETDRLMLDLPILQQVVERWTSSHDRVADEEEFNRIVRVVDGGFTA